jgi:CTP synthase
LREQLGDLDGILIAPGFGNRGIEGKIEAIRFARENDVPCLGICLGMQCMVIEYGRNVLGFKDANSTEFDLNTRHNVIDMMEEQKNIFDMGGTMRLGAYACQLKKDSLAYKIYGKERIEERHRHRYEFNNDYRQQYEHAGIVCSGINPDSGLVEIIELPKHNWFIGTQFHPEYSSTVLHPHPLFIHFIKAAIQPK